MSTGLNGKQLDVYIDKVLVESDYSMPDDQTLRAISILVNEATAQSFKETDKFLQNLPEIEKGVQDLIKAPRLRGSAKKAGKPLLEGLTPYEQMHVVKKWVDESSFQPGKKRTIALYNEKGPIPVMITPPPKNKTDLYPLFIGNSKGALKGPVYKEWQEENPKGTERERFIKPLDALEIHRTGQGDGALLLKKGAYESGEIDHTWRYEVYNSDLSLSPKASVELPRQKEGPAIKARAYAPGYNLAKMVQDDHLRNKNIVPRCLYEEFCDDGYDDDAVPSTTPKEILKSLKPAAKGDPSELNSLIATLSATHLGVSEIPVVRKFAAQKLKFVER